MILEEYEKERCFEDNYQGEYPMTQFSLFLKILIYMFDIYKYI